MVTLHHFSTLVLPTFMSSSWNKNKIVAFLVERSAVQLYMFQDRTPSVLSWGIWNIFIYESSFYYHFILIAEHNTIYSMYDDLTSSFHPLFQSLPVHIYGPNTSHDIMTLAFASFNCGESKYILQRTFQCWFYVAVCAC